MRYTKSPLFLYDVVAPDDAAATTAAAANEYDSLNFSSTSHDDDSTPPVLAPAPPPPPLPLPNLPLPNGGSHLNTNFYKNSIDVVNTQMTSATETFTTNQYNNNNDEAATTTTNKVYRTLNTRLLFEDEKTKSTKVIYKYLVQCALMFLLCIIIIYFNVHILCPNINVNKMCIDGVAKWWMIPLHSMVVTETHNFNIYILLWVTQYWVNALVYVIFIFYNITHLCTITINKGRVTWCSVLIYQLYIYRAIYICINVYMRNFTYMLYGIGELILFICGGPHIPSRIYYMYKLFVLNVTTTYDLICILYVLKFDTYLIVVLALSSFIIVILETLKILCTRIFLWGLIDMNLSIETIDDYVCTLSIKKNILISYIINNMINHWSNFNYIYTMEFFVMSTTHHQLMHYDIIKVALRHNQVYEFTILLHKNDILFDVRQQYPVRHKIPFWCIGFERQALPFGINEKHSIIIVDKKTSLAFDMAILYKLKSKYRQSEEHYIYVQDIYFYYYLEDVYMYKILMYFLHDLNDQATYSSLFGQYNVTINIYYNETTNDNFILPPKTTTTLNISLFYEKFNYLFIFNNTFCPLIAQRNVSPTLNNNLFLEMAYGIGYISKSSKITCDLYNASLILMKKQRNNI